MPRLAASSFDKTVRLWDADNHGYSLHTFTGHSASVMSLDFHPTKDDFICSVIHMVKYAAQGLNTGSCSVLILAAAQGLNTTPYGSYYLSQREKKICSILFVMLYFQCDFFLFCPH